MLFALRHPDCRSGPCLVWRVTGGGRAARAAGPASTTASSIAAAQQGGMGAVCDMELWRERIAARPGDPRCG